jgi:hypothetical protein
MKIPAGILLVAFALFAPELAVSAGLSPWQFGMAKEQVKGFNQFGPYKSFSNGDLETFNGVFNGHKENIQFFFQNNRLVRIGVYLSEGRDRNKAIAAFRRACAILQKDYGELIIPGIRVSPKSEPINAETLATAAVVKAVATRKTEMIPAKQPKDMRVSGAIMSDHFRGGNTFAVAIFFDTR